MIKLGKLTKRGNRYCIENTRNGVIGRCFSSRAEASRKLSQAQCTARARAAGRSVNCPLPRRR